MKKSPLIAASLIAISALGLSATYAQEDAPPPPSERGEFKGPHHGPHRGPPPGPRLEELDQNSDGNISREEIAAHETSRFAEIDTNGDGQLTAEELSAHADARREEMRAEREALMARFEEMRQRGEGERRERMFAELDANGDGAISADEFTSRPREMFDRLDANGDGVVDETERQAMRGQRGEHRPGMRGPGRGHHHDRRGPPPADEQPE